MAKNTKTPVMVLQELTVKKNYAPPNYEIVFCKSGTHENTFHYQVQVLDQRAVGVGKSKKEAKHDAARKVLELLANEGILQAEERKEFQDIQADHINVKTPENCIPVLMDICVEHKLTVDFIEICAVGLAHCREFTYECKIANIVTKATSGSKKHAKQFAAKEMLDRIMEVLPELKANCQKQDMEITDRDMEAQEKYNLLFSPHKMNLNTGVCDFHKQFKDAMKEKEIPKETIRKYFDEPRLEKTLEDLLNLFECTYSIEEVQVDPVPISMLSINCDVPLSFMEMGSSINEARTKVLNKAFIVLETFMLL